MVTYAATGVTGETVKKPIAKNPSLHDAFKIPFVRFSFFLILRATTRSSQWLPPAQSIPSWLPSFIKMEED
jgi:hypothetical protein